MQTRHVLVACAALAVSSMASAEEVKLPPEVTPALRAACEGDVRRLGCIDETPTYSEVKSCVMSKYMRLGNRCKVQLAIAGYSGPATAKAEKAGSEKPAAEKTAGAKAASVKAAAAAGKPRQAGFMAIFD